MPKLLQINSAINYGSTGKIAEQIGELAKQQGWESYIAHGRYINPSHQVAIQVGNRLDWLLHALLTRLTDRHGLFSTRATRKLVKHIEEIKPDIIHLHNIHGYYLNYKVLFEYLNKSNIPVVWTLHDCWTMTGHCAYFDYAKCDKWQMSCHNCPQKGTYPVSWVADRSRDNYKEKRDLFTSIQNLILVPVSKWLAGVVQNSFLKDKRVDVIHNGIDVQTFQPKISNTLTKQYNFADKRIVLGVALPWSPRKGLPDFIKLYEKLDIRLYQMVLIGLSKEQIAQLPIGVIGLERTNSVEELAEWYSVADVFVNPTYEDNYPTTNLEAISCGTPVVTYRTGGSPESVTPQTGRVVEQGNIEAVAKAIEELCAEDRDAMRTRCREYAVAHFDKQECFKKYLELYEEIIRKNK